MNGTPELALKLENKSSFRKFMRMAHGLGFKYYIEYKEENNWKKNESRSNTTTAVYDFTYPEINE